MIDCHYPSSYLSYTFTDVTFPRRAIKPLTLSKCASFLTLICKEFEKGKCRSLDVKWVYCIICVFWHYRSEVIYSSYCSITQNDC